MNRLLRLLPILFFLLFPLGSIQAADALLDSILTPTPTWTSEGVDNGVDYGVSVASAGDINNDGYADAIIGAQKYLVDGVRAGSAFVFLGEPKALSKTVHRQLTTRIAGSYFGGAVSGAGDVNGDGYADVIVGSPHYHLANGYEGAAYVYLGSAQGLSDQPAWSKIGPIGAAEFGSAVSSAGDVNGDGYDDILVSARTYSLDLDGDGKFDVKNAGAVFVFLGSQSGPGADPVWSFISDQQEALLGFALAGGCDFNDDGYDDIAFSAPFYDLTDAEPRIADAGKVWVFLGAPDGLESAPAWSAVGPEADARFGSALSCSGDVDRNGYPDLAVGARGYDGEAVDYTDYGAAYLFYNTGGTLSPTPGWMVSGSQPASGFGVSIAIMGDANMDGYDDVAVGAHRYSDDQANEGFVFVYRGGPGGVATVTGTQVSGNKADTDFGFSIAPAGDVNADGKADLLIGAPIYKRDERIVMGRAFLYNGILAGEIVESETLFLPFIVTK